MAKSKEKKSRPVRSLVALFLIIALMYGWLAAGLVQENWESISNHAASLFNKNSSEPSASPSPESSSESTDEPKTDQSDQPTESSSESTPTPESSESSTTAGATDENGNPIDVDNSKPADSKADQNKTPQASLIPKFALDLAGGTQIILTPILDSGQTVDQNALDQAIEVIRQRINASGVAESEINQQGSSNIVVGIPGQTPSDETIKLISNAARMRFRPVLAIGGPTGTFYTSALGTESAINSVSSEGMELGEDGKPTESAIQKALAETSEKDKATFETKKNSDSATGTSKWDGISDEDIKKFDELDCSKEENLKGGSNDESGSFLATCSQDGTAKYMLAPTAVEGDGIEKAVSGLKPLQNGKYSNEWIVSLQFKPEADDQFIAISEQVKKLTSPRNQFAICLDGLVISAPSIQKDTTFTKGNGVEISSGSETDTQKWANTLANQLSFGALPMSFKVDSTEQVSATLGSESLEKGLLAGLIGLILVVLYSLFQYRALGLITIGSLGIAAVLTYGSVLILSWQMGYRLSLPGIIGFIVSIGITADSFIVYFERVRDELRDGRPLSYAVSRGWQRALRTIMASDFVNVLAAFILFFLAVGGVRGFAFTLGLTTFIDFLVVILFTHPIVTLLARRRFFYAGHPASGLSTYNLGAKDAVRYSKLSKSEKEELKASQKAEILAKKEQKAKLQEGIKGAKIAKKDAARMKKLHSKASDLEFKERAKLLKLGKSHEEVFEAIPFGSGMTIAQRKLELEKKNAETANKESNNAADKPAKTVAKPAAKSSAVKSTSKPAAKRVVKPAAKSATKSKTVKKEAK